MYVWVRWSHRLLPRDRAVLRRDMLLLLPEEQLQELPDVLHAGKVLPKLLLPCARCMNWWWPAAATASSVHRYSDMVWFDFTAGSGTACNNLYATRYWYSYMDVMMLSYSLSWMHHWWGNLKHMCFSRINTIPYCRMWSFFRFNTVTMLCWMSSDANLYPQNKILESSSFFDLEVQYRYGNPWKQTGYQIFTGHEYLGQAHWKASL